MTTSDVNPAKVPQAEKPSERQAARSRRRRYGVFTASLAAIGVLLVLGLAPASRLFARGLPQPPDGSAPAVTGPEHATISGVRDVPVGLPRGAHIREARDVLPYAVAALGRPGASALMTVLRSSYLLARPVGYHAGFGHADYPYQYPSLNAVLDKAPLASFASGATALGAALTVLAAQPYSAGLSGGESRAITNAGPAAYGVLNRARAAGGCAPQLDLLLLLTAGLFTTPDIISHEEQ